MSMKVLLRESIKNVGDVGEVIEVADGYARNYLLPRKMAFELNASNLQIIEGEKRRRAERLEAMKDDCRLLAEQIEKTDITLSERTHDGDNLYGAIQPRAIADALAEENLHVDPDMLHVEEPIKKLGVHTVHVRLHPEVTAELKVWVVEQKGE